MEVNTGEIIGLKRKIDELGRVTLPKEFRKDLNINEKDTVEIFQTKNGVFIRKEN